LGIYEGIRVYELRFVQAWSPFGIELLVNEVLMANMQQQMEERHFQLKTMFVPSII
jgi:hypothetical protein